MRTVNVLRVELDDGLDDPPFHNAATSVGERLGARRMGAGVYEAEAGAPIWPYHYHHGIEEWLYVLDGAPVLRDPGGERTLAPGDLVAFPVGPGGAHTVSGPGRFVIFDTGHDTTPHMSVYPDSDKISGPGGILPRSSAVGYWHGEGTAVAGPPEVRREPDGLPRRPIVNVGERTGPIGPLLGAERLEGTLLDLEPGEGAEPYHYVHGREQWLLVLAGTATVRHAEGEAELGAGDLVCFEEGPAGAHELRNRGGSTVRALLLSTTGLPANVHYPDTGRWRLRNGSGQEDVLLPGP